MADQAVAQTWAREAKSAVTWIAGTRRAVSILETRRESRSLRVIYAHCHVKITRNIIKHAARGSGGKARIRSNIAKIPVPVD